MKKRIIKKWVKVAIYKITLIIIINLFIVKGFNIELGLYNLGLLMFINVYLLGLCINFNNIDL